MLRLHGPESRPGVGTFTPTLVSKAGQPHLEPHTVFSEPLLGGLIRKHTHFYMAGANMCRFNLLTLIILVCALSWDD